MFTQRHIAVQGIDSKMTLFTHSPKYLYSKVEKAYDKLSNIVQRAKAYQTVYQALSHLVIMNERIRIHFAVIITTITKRQSVNLQESSEFVSLLIQFQSTEVPIEIQYQRDFPSQISYL